VRQTLVILYTTLNNMQVQPETMRSTK